MHAKDANSCRDISICIAITNTDIAILIHGAAEADEMAKTSGRTTSHAGNRWRVASPDHHPQRNGRDPRAMSTPAAEVSGSGRLERARIYRSDKAESAGIGSESRKVSAL